MDRKLVIPHEASVEQNSPTNPSLTVEERIRRHVENITHEIQIRLQAVLAYAEILAMSEQSLSPDEIKRLSHELLSCVLALDTVVRNLSEYEEDYRFSRMPIGPLLEQAKRMYEAEAARRGVTIRIQLQPEEVSSPSLEISQRELQYAFNNLVHNAVKYSFAGSAQRNRYVLITGQPEGEFYELRIENYGVGILSDEVTSGAVFQDGYRGKLTRDEYRTGSGKGLFVAKRVIDKHHGRIEVSSTPVHDQASPEGQPHLTRFSVYLPYEQPKKEINRVENHRLD